MLVTFIFGGECLGALLILFGRDSYLFSAGCLLAMVAGMYVAYRQDPYRTARFGAGYAGFVALVAVAVIISTSTYTPIPIAIAVVAIVGTVLAVRALILLHRTPGEFPDYLRERFPPHAIREYGDVQWVATESDPALGVPNLLEFFLQNCVDGPREVTIKLAVKNAVLAVPEKISAKLGPCEVKKVSVPVRLRSGRAGNADIDIAFAATGQSGRRVRKIHAAQSKSPSSTLLRTLTAVTTGVVVWGGGEYFPFTIHPTSDSAVAEMPREPQVTLLWSPSADTGAKGARTAAKSRS